jgi:cytosine/adenosine deaminase-related metal-dependent hydrolase
MKALVNVRLYDYQTFIDQGYVMFDETVVEVGPMADFKGCEEIVDGGGKFLIPGLINGHMHFYSAFARGFSFDCEPESFKDMLEQVWWRLDGQMTLEDVYWSAIALGRESLLKGVVGVIDHHASGAIKGSLEAVEKAMADVGLHGVTCFETSDRFDIDEAIEENCQMVQRTGGPFGLHASMTLSDATLNAVKLAIGNYPIHCHVAESLQDQVFEPLTPVERLDAFGLLGPKSLLAHCVHISDSDAASMKDRGAIVALNPRSNQNNAVGTFNYGRFHRYDLPLIVGTDGLGADVAQSWQALYYAVMASEHRVLMSLDALKAHLVESYRIYEAITGIKLGRFCTGYRFDALLVDYHAYTPVTAGNVFAHVFYGLFDDLRIQKLWSGGALLMDHYELIGVPDVPQMMAESLWHRMEGKDEY